MSWAVISQSLTKARILARLLDSGYRYVIHPAETEQGLTAANLTFGFDPLDVRRYGAKGDGNGAGGGTNDQAAIATALGVASHFGKGAEVKLMAGTHRCDSALMIPANAALIGHGPNSTALDFTNIATATDHITATDVSYVGIKRLSIIASNIAANAANVIHVAATAADVYEPVLEDLQVQNVPPSGKGIFLDCTTANHNIYWPDLSRITVSGGAAGAYSAKTALQVGGATANQSVVGATLRHVRAFRVATGFLLNNCDTVRGTDCSLDDCQGGGGRGLYFVKASYCKFTGLRMEPGTFDTYIQHAATSADNFVECMQLSNIPAAKYADAGIRNDLYGSDGSGGLNNILQHPLTLTRIRSLTVGDAQTPAGIGLQLIYSETAAVNPGNIGANSTYEAIIAIAGTLQTDLFVVTPEDLEGSLTFCAVAIAGGGGVRIRVTNPTTGAINAASRSWSIMVFRF